MVDSGTLLAVILGPLGAYVGCGTTIIGCFAIYTNCANYQNTYQAHRIVCRALYDSVCTSAIKLEQVVLDYSDICNLKEMILPYSSDQVRESWLSTKDSISTGRQKQISKELYTAATFELWASAPRGRHVFTDVQRLFSNTEHHDLRSQRRYCPQCFGDSNPLETYLQPHIVETPEGQVHHILVELSRLDDEDYLSSFRLNIYLPHTWPTTNLGLGQFEDLGIFNFVLFPTRYLLDALPHYYRVNFGDDPLLGLWSLYRQRLLRPADSEHNIQSWLKSCWRILTGIHNTHDNLSLDLAGERALLLQAVAKLYSWEQIPFVTHFHPFSDLEVKTHEELSESYIIDIDESE